MSNRANGFSGEVPAPQMIEVPLLGTPLDRVICNPQCLGGQPVIVGPVCRIQIDGGPPPGSQQIAPVFILLNLLARGMTYTQLKAGNPWLVDEDIDACKLWFRTVMGVCCEPAISKTTLEEMQDEPIGG